MRKLIRSSVLAVGLFTGALGACGDDQEIVGSDHAAGRAGGGGATAGGAGAASGGHAGLGRGGANGTGAAGGTRAGGSGESSGESSGTSGNDALGGDSGSGGGAGTGDRGGNGGSSAQGGDTTSGGAGIGGRCDDAPEQPLAECPLVSTRFGEQSSVSTGCSFEDTCQQQGCGELWSELDGHGCRRPDCASSDDCGSNERCVAPVLEGAVGCFDYYDECSLSDCECSCSRLAVCAAVAYCYPASQYPVEDDCSLTGLGCYGLDDLRATLENYADTTNELYFMGDVRTALDACMSNVEAALQGCDLDTPWEGDCPADCTGAPAGPDSPCRSDQALWSCHGGDTASYELLSTMCDSTGIATPQPGFCCPAMFRASCLHQ